MNKDDLICLVAGAMNIAKEAQSDGWYAEIVARVASTLIEQALRNENTEALKQALIKAGSE